MHKNTKIIICKFGEECKFKHLNLNEMNKILIEFEDLKQKYESLKRKMSKFKQFRKKRIVTSQMKVHTHYKIDFLKKT